MGVVVTKAMHIAIQALIWPMDLNLCAWFTGLLISLPVKDEKELYQRAKKNSRSLNVPGSLDYLVLGLLINLTILKLVVLVPVSQELE